jgi:hypothetical protein
MLLWGIERVLRQLKLPGEWGVPPAGENYAQKVGWYVNI